MLKSSGFLFHLPTFATMKQRFPQISLSFAVMILVAIVLQSFHSYEHLSKFFAEKECHHKYDNKAEIGHAHHELDHCFACEFTFSTSIKSEIFAFKFFNNSLPTGYTLSYSKEITNHFKGSLFALRAPPIFIV